VLQLATVEHGPKLYILLPYAKYGDLGDFLHCGIGPDKKINYNFDYRFNKVRNNDIRLPLLHQCWVLADALAWLHTGIAIEKSSSTVFCVHMDLKLANILIQDDPKSAVGKWMISDFGISESHGNLRDLG
jgi:serine/threonine protein kinase